MTFGLVIRSSRAPMDALTRRTAPAALPIALTPAGGC
jgi:hypothetical protein